MIEIHDVIKIYRQESDSLFIPALRGINLTIQKGNIYVLIGPSGSGKSTLIKLIAGFDTPSSGRITHEGIGRIDQLKGRKLDYYHRELLGFVFQYPHMNLMNHLSVYENVLFPLRISSKYTISESKDRVIKLLQILDIQDKKDSKPSELSGGEALRVSIAIALANNPPLVIADEPTGELDSENSYKLRNYIQKINKTWDTTFIIVTHDERFKNIADFVFKIRDGYINEKPNNNILKNLSDVDNLEV